MHHVRGQRRETTTVAETTIWHRMGEEPGLKYYKADELIGGRCAGNQGSRNWQSEERKCHATPHTDRQTEGQRSWKYKGKYRCTAVAVTGIHIREEE